MRRPRMPSPVLMCCCLVLCCIVLSCLVSCRVALWQYTDYYMQVDQRGTWMLEWATRDKSDTSPKHSIKYLLNVRGACVGVGCDVAPSPDVLIVIVTPRVSPSIAASGVQPVGGGAAASL